MAPFTKPTSADLRAKALRFRTKAARSWWSSERTKRLGRRAWNYESAARLAERQEREARIAAYDQARARSVA